MDNGLVSTAVLAQAVIQFLPLLSAPYPMYMSHLIQCKVLGPVRSLSVLPALNSTAAGIGVQAGVRYMCMIISIWTGVVLLKLWFGLYLRAFLKPMNSRPL